MSKKTKRIVYWITVGLLSAVIVVCSVTIGYKLITDAQDKGDYDALESIRASANTNATRPPIPTDPNTGVADPSGPVPTETTADPNADPEMIYEYQVIHAINNDTVGWIEIPGTEINYPVVQSPYQENFYLRRNFEKQYATCGTIYAREECDILKPSDNITLYGHNMSNGTMFADLHLYEDEAFWKDNRYIFFDTLYEYHTYEIFAVFVSSADLVTGFRYHLFADAANAGEYDEFVSTCKELSLYDTGITPQYGEKLLTLSTCDKSIDQGRLVVVARRVV